MPKNSYRRSFKERNNPFRPFGGRLLGENGNAREERPISEKHSMLLVMRASSARSSRSLRHKKNRKKVDGIVYRQAQKWGIKIYEYANVGNHLHILMRVSTRENYVRFIRAVSGLIARWILRAERGRPSGRYSFWDHRPFTRVVLWGKAFAIARSYVKKNENEARSGLSRVQIQLLEEEPYEPDPGELQEIYANSS